jgi:formylglycine-generating enzyme required for sulfatase activity
MVVAPAGSFTMGSSAAEIAALSKEFPKSAEYFKWEAPQRTVKIAAPFAVGKFAVTFDEWAACVKGGGCQTTKAPADEGWGKGRRPVINVSWDDAKEYVAWLSATTGKTYRLLSEAEREYVARAGTTTRFWWGPSITTVQANYDGNYSFGGSPKGEYRAKTMPVDSFQPNPWGLYQVHGNVWEWTEDCWHDSYTGAPTDGSAWITACTNGSRVLRGGSWGSDPRYLRAASRFGVGPDVRGNGGGFRVARFLFPART